MTHSAGSHRQAGSETKTARRKGGRRDRTRGRRPQDSSQARRQGRRTHETNTQNTGRKTEPSERQAGERKRGNEARQNRRTDRQTDTKTTRRDDGERTNEGEGKEHQKPTQPTALKIISALPDCSTLLYCCQAYRIIRARSASSASDAQERTKATVSSAGRPPASKTNGTSSPPEGGSGTSCPARRQQRPLHLCARVPADSARSRCGRR